MNNPDKLELKKDFSCFEEGHMIRFKKGDVLVLDGTHYRTEDGRTVQQSTVKFYSQFFKPL